MFRVLQLPTTVGGNPQGLSKHLNILGLESETLVLRQNHYNYPADTILWKENESIHFREVKRWVAFSRNFLRYDIIHFNYGATLFYPSWPYNPGSSPLKEVLRKIYSLYTRTLQVIELKTYKWLRKPMFIHYQGDDARQGDYSSENFEYNIASQVNDSYYNRYSDEFKRTSIRRLGHYCEQIYAVNPDLLHVLPEGSRFIPYSHISLDDWKPIYTQDQSDGPLRIGHAPSDRQVKGTDLFLSSLDELKSEGYSFELVLVEGLSNAEARKRYETIDVLLDQLFAGWYGGLAVEAMALGKPVLVYIREGDLKFIPKEMKDDLPFVQVNPDTIKEGLRKVLDMPRSELLVLAKKSREYVEKWHDPLKIAQEIKDDYEKALRKYNKF